MLFNSYEFLIFFPIVCLVYFIIPKKFQYIWLLVASYFFYACWNAKYTLLLLFSTVCTWLCGVIMGKIEHKKTALIINIILTLSVLFVFKYSGFVAECIDIVLKILHIQSTTPKFDLVLPVGISFYTFQALSYSIDVYRGEIETEKNFFRYALFVSFFPQLVAGPIERSKNLLKQVNESHRFDYFRMRDGLLLMLWGYFLKLVIADRAALFVDAVYNDYETYGGSYLVVASVLFAIQIYCDFAGYSTIAIGAAKVMDFDLMENFNHPYLSISVSEFWRNWHISLTSWFRDYLYIPLGGNRKGKLRKHINIMIVFLVSGLWHGQSLNFVVWGGINGLYHIVGVIASPIRKKIEDFLKITRESWGYKVICGVLTFAFVDLAWVFFRAESLGVAVGVIKSMLNARKNIEIMFDGSLYDVCYSQKNFTVLVLAIFILFFSDYLKLKGIRIREEIVKQDFIIRWIIYLVATMGVLIFGIWGPSFSSSNFIYFQF